MKPKGSVLYCFSPPVMLATFLIEIALIIYATVRYKMSPVVRVACAMLFLLALFQIAEYNVCGNFSVWSDEWSKTGYAAITLLPPLGIHLAHLMAGKQNRLLVGLAYGTGLIWAAVFGLSDWAFTGHVCGGNYVMFQLRQDVTTLYGAYYYLWLLVGIALCVWYAAQSKTPKIRQALRYQAAGYLAFMVPTAVVVIVQPEASRGIPSILCGFAVLFALILAFGILPRVAKRN